MPLVRILNVFAGISERGTVQDSPLIFEAVVRIVSSPFRCVLQMIRIKPS